MAYQVVPQPNGNYSIWSTVTDKLVAHDGTREEIVDWFVNREKKRVEERIGEVIDQLDRGEEPYFQFGHTWDEVKHTLPPEWI